MIYLEFSVFLVRGVSISGSRVLFGESWVILGRFKKCRKLSYLNNKFSYLNELHFNMPVCNQTLVNVDFNIFLFKAKNKSGNNVKRKDLVFSNSKDFNVGWYFWDLPWSCRNKWTLKEKLGKKSIWCNVIKFGNDNIRFQKELLGKLSLFMIKFLDITSRQTCIKQRKKLKTYYYSFPTSGILKLCGNKN